MMSCGGKPTSFGQHAIGARADLDFASCDVSAWPLFIERHHHHGRAVAANESRLLDEFLLAFLQADRIDDALALDAFQARLQ